MPFSHLHLVADTCLWLIAETMSLWLKPGSQQHCTSYTQNMRQTLDAVQSSHPIADIIDHSSNKMLQCMLWNPHITIVACECTV